jgi:hypothetical protein
MASRKLATNMAQLGTRNYRDFLTRSIPSHALRKAEQKSNMATVAPPVTQNSTSSKGPTAMVFMNMGGPAKTEDVGDFLSRLFVSPTPHPSLLHALIYAIRRRMETLSHSVDYSPTLDP